MKSTSSNLNNKTRQDPGTRPSFRQLMSDEHEVYYENVETGEVFWKMPDDGDLEEEELFNVPMVHN